MSPELTSATRSRPARTAESRGGQAPLDRVVSLQQEIGNDAVTALIGRPAPEVRIHRNDTADARARGHDAVAFTEGADIHFRSGAFRPNTRAGMTVLAHELAHVVQQAQGHRDATRRDLPHSSPEELEREADAVASSGTPIAAAGSAPAGAVQTQRLRDYEETLLKPTSTSLLELPSGGSVPSAPATAPAAPAGPRDEERAYIDALLGTPSEVRAMRGKFANDPDALQKVLLSTAKGAPRGFFNRVKETVEGLGNIADKYNKAMDLGIRSGVAAMREKPTRPGTVDPNNPGVRYLREDPQGRAIGAFLRNVITDFETDPRPWHVRFGEGLNALVEGVQGSVKRDLGSVRRDVLGAPTPERFGAAVGSAYGKVSADVVISVVGDALIKELPKVGAGPPVESIAPTPIGRPLLPPEEVRPPAVLPTRATLPPEEVRPPTLPPTSEPLQSAGGPALTPGEFERPLAPQPKLPGGEAAAAREAPAGQLATGTGAVTQSAPAPQVSAATRPVGLRRVSPEAMASLERALANDPELLGRMRRSFGQAGDDIIEAVNRFHGQPGFDQVVKEYLAGGPKQTGARFVLRQAGRLPADVTRATLFEVPDLRNFTLQGFRGSGAARISDLWVAGARTEFKSVMDVRHYVSRQLSRDIVSASAGARDWAEVVTELERRRWVFDAEKMAAARLTEEEVAQRMSDWLFDEGSFLRHHPHEADIRNAVRRMVEFH